MMKHLVQKIYEFFYDNPSLEKHKTLSDFLDTLPGFRIEEDNGVSRIDMNLANYVSSICKQMANDMLLIPVKTNPTFCQPHVYYPIGESNIGDYAAFWNVCHYSTQLKVYAKIVKISVHPNLSTHYPCFCLPTYFFYIAT